MAAAVDGCGMAAWAPVAGPRCRMSSSAILHVLITAGSFSLPMGRSSRLVGWVLGMDQIVGSNPTRSTIFKWFRQVPLSKSTPSHGRWPHAHITPGFALGLGCDVGHAWPVRGGGIAPRTTGRYSSKRMWKNIRGHVDIMINPGRADLLRYAARALPGRGRSAASSGMGERTEVGASRLAHDEGRGAGRSGRISVGPGSVG